jgi:hypothetical protein
MIVEKLGKIFDPTDHVLPQDCREFAQSPQTLEFADFVRVYFSTRSVDEGEKTFRSHMSYVDMTKDFTSIIRVAHRPVLPLGELGCFDEHGIFPMNVIRNEGQVWGYTCGWSRRHSVSVETGIGLVVSEDEGETFRRLGSGPILGPSLNEPFLVGDAFVIQTADGFHMWYMFGQRWKREIETAAPDRVYKIGHAVSPDGIQWTKQEGRQILPDRLGIDECQALPSVIFFGDRYHMVFCYRHVHGFRTDPTKGYKIGYATSGDLVNWDRQHELLGLNEHLEDWDSDMQCYPHLAVISGKPYLLYNGNAFGRFGFGAAELSLA